MRCYFLHIPLSLKEQEHNKEKELENALDEMKRINDKRHRRITAVLPIQRSFLDG